MGLSETFQTEEASLEALTYCRNMDISNKSEDQQATANRKYLHWQDEGVEKIPPHEAEDIQAVADMINNIQKAQYNMHRHCYSGAYRPQVKENQTYGY